MGQREASARKQTTPRIDALLAQQQSDALNEIAEHNSDFDATRCLTRRIRKAAIAVQFRQAQIHRNSNKSQSGMQRGNQKDQGQK